MWEIDTGHDLMITEPDAVAAALLEIATLLPLGRQLCLKLAEHPVAGQDVGDA